MKVNNNQAPLREENDWYLETLQQRNLTYLEGSSRKNSCRRKHKPNNSRQISHDSFN